MSDLRVRFPCIVVAERRVQAAGIKPIHLISSLARKILVRLASGMGAKIYPSIMNAICVC